MTAVEAAIHMVGRQKITILTGSSLSAASGIPTFDGREVANCGFAWNNQKKYAEQNDVKRILTRSFFDKNPWAVWEWHYDFNKFIKNK